MPAPSRVVELDCKAAIVDARFESGCCRNIGTKENCDIGQRWRIHVKIGLKCQSQFLWHNGIQCARVLHARDGEYEALRTGLVSNAGAICSDTSSGEDIISK